MNFKLILTDLVGDVEEYFCDIMAIEEHYIVTEYERKRSRIFPLSHYKMVEIEYLKDIAEKEEGDAVSTH
jgi:hypothetical protein